MENYKTSADWIKNADAIVVLTGAGMGVDSGMQTFRGKSGKWGAIEATENKSIFELSNPISFIENPKWIWGLFAQRMKEYENTPPHEGFYLLKNWIEKLNLDYFILTSNIDQHFQKAGFEENKIREVHGSFGWLQSTKPKENNEIWKNNLNLDTLAQEIEEGKFPLCKDNTTMARPNIYLFRDFDYLDTYSKTKLSFYEKFLSNNHNKKIVAIEIGSGPHVQTIRTKTRELITKNQAKAIRINPNDFAIKSPHIGINEGALDALKAINNYL